MVALCVGLLWMNTPVSVPEISGEVKIDGHLDEAIWDRAAQVPVTHEWFPGDNLDALVATTCLIIHDGDTLYVGFRALDPNPSAIRAHLADRDVPLNDDNVGIIIDTFNDQRRGYQFRANALGVQLDAVNDEISDSEDWSWDAIWDAAGAIFDWGYSVEMAIPFKQLRFPRDAGPMTWGLLAMRDYPRDVKHQLRSIPIDRNRNCIVCQFPTVVGFEGLEPGRNLQVIPTATTTRTEARDPETRGGFETQDEDTELGLSARWSATPNLTLQGTLNPDFAQVEADSAQLNVNERFALYFPEKRPFFLEGSDFFDTPISAVFTRSVIQPRYGLKFTGKEGANGIGVLITEDQFNQIIEPGYQGSSTRFTEEDATTSVVRWRRDIGKGSSIGALATYRESGSYHNANYGVDGVWQLAEGDRLQFQVMRSDTTDPQGSISNDSGTAAYVRYRHNSRNWIWSARAAHFDEDYRADAGFVTQVGYRFAQAGVSRVLWGGESRWFRKFWLNVSTDFTQSSDGSIHENGQDIGVEYEGPNQSYISINLAPNREHYQGADYHHFRQSLYVSMRPSGTLGWVFYLNRGETIDFTNSQSADFITLNPAIQWSLGRRTQADLEYLHQTLEVASGRLFRAQLAELHLTYHVNLRTFLRAIVQYRDVTRTPENYSIEVDRHSEDLFTQFLFSYKLNPQTLILAGYSDNYAGRDPYDLTQTDRSYYLKVGYAWLP
ncbi:MAG: carbohydrate binding family 9 domain-containing protein [Acidobacteria bacterium]|nr:carbohydrate binding family 9 domain-containing protein [Acidobacteriota bacterium]